MTLELAQIDAVMQRLAPMHLRVGPQGELLSIGSTLARIVGQASTLDQAFEIVHPAIVDAGKVIPALTSAERIFLRPRHDAADVLRGRAAMLPDGGALVFVGFGIGLVEAIRRFDLTDRDFAPSDLAMELLFLHEANGAMTSELSRSNIRLEEARVAAENQAYTDPLTGLFNRRGMTVALEAAIRMAAAAPELPFALIHVDLDFFKSVNDRHGHAAGDETLRQVAGKLRAATRIHDSIARMGGDEFMMLLPGIADPEQLRRLGRRIIDAVEEPILIGAAECRVSASLGIAVSTSYAVVDAERIQKDADAALYLAKGAGRGCVRLAGEDEAACADLPPPGTDNRAQDGAARPD